MTIEEMKIELTDSVSTRLYAINVKIEELYKEIEDLQEEENKLLNLKDALDY